MKTKYILIFFVVLTAALFVMCGGSKPAQNEAEQNSAEQTVEETENVEESEALALPPEGVFVIDGSLSELRADGKMHWKSNFNAGDTVGWTGEKKEAVRAYDGQTRTFYRVKADGDYWVHDYFIAGPAMPAVITGAETVLYTKPEPAAVARSGIVTLPKYTLIAMFQDTNVDDVYMPVAVHLGGALPETRYVKIEDISWVSADVNTVKLARIASFTKNPAARRELQSTAMELAGQSASFSHVAEEVQYDSVLFELEMTNNLESVGAELEYMVTSETLNIRELPSLDAATTGAMKQGDLFWVTARSKNEVTLEAGEGETEKPKGVWLRLGEGHWVFSAFAVPNPALQ
jgi:hypothetical protein